jgi:uncharacterized protein YbaR (Trm112 family)
VSFDPKLLDGLLVCTKCRSELVRDADSLVCVKPECRLQYSIGDEIPNMLLEDARALSNSDWGAVMRRAARDPGSGAKRKPHPSA